MIAPVRYRVLAAAALFCGSTSLASPAHAGQDPFAGSAAAYIVRVDGVTLWAGEAEARVATASLTKLMTALIVAEALDPVTIVTVSAGASRAIGMRMGLLAGTRIAASELIAGMLLRSANDACLALVERVAGSELRFVAKMNARAEAMGLADTRYTNACGFDAAGHYSSAIDLARIADEVFAQPVLAKMLGQQRHVARAANGATFALANSNAPAASLPGVVGVKAGATAQAGYCVVAAAKRDGVRILVVVLGARGGAPGARAMIERAFEHAGASR